MKLYETVRTADGAEHTIELEGEAAEVAMLYDSVQDVGAQGEFITGTLEETVNEKNLLVTLLATLVAASGDMEKGNHEDAADRVDFAISQLKLHA